MEILVNETPLEFKLDQAIPLVEVIEHISEWAADSDNYILDYKVTPELAPGETMLSSSIERLEIQVGDRSALIQHNLMEVSAYVEQVGAFVAERTQKEEAIEEISTIADGMKWCIDSLGSIEKQLGIVENEKLAEAKATILETDLSTPLLFIQALAILRNHILVWTKQHVLSQLSEEEIKALKDKFKDQVPQLLKLVEDIATSLTVGKEAQAMTGIEQLVEYFSELLALLGRDQNQKEFSEKLVGLLSELTSALDSADLVTAADIIDYDLKDVLDELQAVA